MSSKRPADVLRDSNLKASIWENEEEKGSYFTTTFAKTYRDQEGNYHDTSSFNNNDLLRVSELARQAYGRTNELRQENKQVQSQEAAPAPTPEPAPTQTPAPAPEPQPHTPSPQEELAASMGEQREQAAQSHDYGK